MGRRVEENKERKKENKKRRGKKGKNMMRLEEMPNADAMPNPGQPFFVIKTPVIQLV
jgi:hypothetical protein